MNSQRRELGEKRETISSGNTKQEAKSERRTRRVKRRALVIMPDHKAIRCHDSCESARWSLCETRGSARAPSLATGWGSLATPPKPADSTCDAQACLQWSHLATESARAHPRGAPSARIGPHIRTTPSKCLPCAGASATLASVTMARVQAGSAAIAAERRAAPGTDRSTGLVSTKCARQVRNRPTRARTRNPPPRFALPRGRGRARQAQTPHPRRMVRRASGAQPHARRPPTEERQDREPRMPSTRIRRMADPPSSHRA